MNKKETQWVARNADEEKIKELISCAKVPRTIALTLATRGITLKNYDIFTNPKLKSLSDPFLIPDLKRAVKRIWDAIFANEKILIYGDYDTDGITSTTILLKVLSQNGGDISCFLPHRFDNGYGFTVESVEQVIKEHHPKLIVTVDCGIGGVEAVEKAKELGVDVIISDHHEPPETTPAAFALINPKLHKETSDLSVLAGVGISFKLCHGFIKFGRENKLGGTNTDLKNILDLVALGTVADIVPLLGENRILVKAGLKELASQIRPGIRALCEAANIDSKLTPFHIAFNLAPRLNAAGRFGSPDEAFRLLSTDNLIEAYQIAETLDEYNALRKETENQIYNEALKQIGPANALVGAALTAGKDWHLGVVGIVASRLTKDYFRPSIVLSIEGDTASGSGRSLGDINLIEILNDTSDHLIRYGGHPMAAGLSLKTEDIPEFFSAFNKSLEKYCTSSSFTPQIDYDGIVELQELDQNFFNHLEMLAPFGHSNSEPVYRINNLVPKQVLSATEKHTRGILASSSDNSKMSFIAFNQTKKSFPETQMWDVIAKPQVNIFRGRESFQLQILGAKASTNF